MTLSAQEFDFSFLDQQVFNWAMELMETKNIAVLWTIDVCGGTGQEDRDGTTL